MGNILCVYGSAYGQTERVVQRIAASLNEHGIATTVHSGKQLPPELVLSNYDGFVIASSIIGGHHQTFVRDFVRRNLSYLHSSPSVFISVSGSAASDRPEKQAEARRYVDEFLQATGWRARRSVTFGGGIAYRKYGFFLRFLMKQINRRTGGPTDTSRNHDLTDWNAVARFADELVDLFQPAVTAGS